MKLNNLSVIILTYNEEKNLPQALDSLCDWANHVFILDSFSTDKTLEIAKRYNCQIFQNRFENYAKQRNFALEKLPIKTEWIFFLDADEWLTKDLKKEILSLIATYPEDNGFYVKRRFMWMGKWIRRGYYPSLVLRLFRYGKGHCEDRAINEHIIVEGKVDHLRHDLIHEDRKGITDWITKHNNYATYEALELLRQIGEQQEIDARFWGTKPERTRWLRYKVWYRLPPLLRPFIYFFYRYIVCGGFLDGRAAFIYHFLQALWFQLLIDLKYLELKTTQSQIKTDVSLNGKR
jgi:glycosyltransferase involved in cell wall biosynthesis